LPNLLKSMLPNNFLKSLENVTLAMIKSISLKLLNLIL